MSEIDAELNLKNELDEVKEILYTHVGLFNTHLEDFKRHEEKVDTMHQELLDKINTASDSTKDLVIAWQTATSTIKFISIVGSIIKWLSGIAIGFGVLYTALNGQVPTGK